MKGKLRILCSNTSQYWAGLLCFLLASGGLMVALTYAGSVVQAQASGSGAAAVLSRAVADNFDSSTGGSTGFTGSDGALPWANAWQNPGSIYVQSFSGWSHTIALRASSQQGNVASATVQVTVVDDAPDSQPLRLYLPLVTKE